MTKLKFINVFILQWLFIRLTRCRETIVIEANVLSYDLMPDGNISARGIGKTKTLEWYSIQGLIIPTTGWVGDFKRIGRPFFLRLTKKKEV